MAASKKAGNGLAEPIGFPTLLWQGARGGERKLRPFAILPIREPSVGRISANFGYFGLSNDAPMRHHSDPFVGAV